MPYLNMLYECKRFLVFQQGEEVYRCEVTVGVAVLCILSTVYIPFSCVSSLCPRGVIISFLLSLESFYQSSLSSCKWRLALK